MKKLIAIATVIAGLGTVAIAEHNGARTIKNVIVYQQQGRFGGWPANHGMWAWGDEIVVGFEAGHYKYSERSHAIDYSRPAEHLLARSLDGGETWKLEKPKSLLPPLAPRWPMFRRRVGESRRRIVLAESTSRIPTSR